MARSYKPLSQEKQAKKNAALLEKRRAMGVKPQKVLTDEERKASARRRTAEYRERNKEKIIEKRSEKRDEIRERARENYRKNKEGYLASSKKWKKKNPEKVRVSLQNYRAKKRDNGGVLSHDISQRLMKLQRGMCAACRSDISKNFHLDHINPVSSGGENTDSNIQLLCPSCNMSKQAQHPIDFMQRKGFLL